MAARQPLHDFSTLRYSDSSGVLKTAFCKGLNIKEELFPESFIELFRMTISQSHVPVAHPDAKPFLDCNGERCLNEKATLGKGVFCRFNDITGLSEKELGHKARFINEAIQSAFPPRSSLKLPPRTLTKCSFKNKPHLLSPKLVYEIGVMLWELGIVPERQNGETVINVKSRPFFRTSIATIPEIPTVYAPLSSFRRIHLTPSFVFQPYTSAYANRFMDYMIATFGEKIGYKKSDIIVTFLQEKNGLWATVSCSDTANVARMHQRLDAYEENLARAAVAPKIHS